MRHGAEEGGVTDWRADQADQDEEADEVSVVTAIADVWKRGRPTL